MMPIDLLKRVRSVAIVGASRSPEKPGHIILRNFLRSFRGRIYPVNPSAKEILGLRCYGSIKKIPYPVEMAIIIVPSGAVVETLEEAATKGVKMAIVISEVQHTDMDRLMRVVAESGLRLLGPGSIGIYMPRRGLNTLFLDPLRQGYPHHGPVGIVSQSGAVGTQILDILAETGLGVSIFIGLGRELDITLLEALSALAGDEETDVLTAYLEGIEEGREFYTLAKRITVEKPFLALVGGVESAGQVYVKSHTGRLGGGKIIKGVLRQAGVIELRDLDMVGEIILHLLHQPLPKGTRLGIVTGAGGYGISLVDKAMEEDVEIRSYIDVGGTSGDDAYIEALKKVCRRDDVDAVVVIPYYPSPSLSSEFNQRLVDEMTSLWRRGFYKPLTVLTYPYGYSFRASLRLAGYGVPVSYSPSSYIYILKRLVEYRRYLERRMVYRKWVERRSYSI